MAIANALSFTAKFDRDVDSATYNKFVLTDDTDYATEGIALANVVGFWQITYPDGTVRTGSFAAPDITANVSLVFNTLALPVDSANEIQNGTYSFIYNIRVGGGVQPGDYATSAFSITTTTPYDDIPTAPTIGFESDCFYGTIEASDDTDYGVWSISTQVMSVYPPPSLGLPTYTVAAGSLTYNFAYTGGYETEVDTLMIYAAGIFTLTYRLKGSIYEVINCDINLCSLYGCVEAFFEKVRTMAGNRLGKTTIPPIVMESYLSVMEYLARFQYAVRCQETADATELYAQLKDILSKNGCSCGCDADDDTPQPFEPICNAANSQIYVTTTSGAHLTSSASTVGNTTTYTVTTSAGFNATFTQYGVDIAALQADVTTLQADVSTLQTDVTTLEGDILNQIVATATPANVPAGGVFTSMISVNYLANTLLEGMEIHGQANFRTVAGSGTKDVRVLANASTLLQLNSAAFNAMGEQIYITAKFLIGATSGANTFIYPYITMKWATSALPNVIQEEKVFSTTFTVPAVTLNALLFDIQASDTLALNTGMGLNNFKQFNEV
jgi:hypothetical protein